MATDVCWDPGVLVALDDCSDAQSGRGSRIRQLSLDFVGPTRPTMASRWLLAIAGGVSISTLASARPVPSKAEIISVDSQYPRGIDLNAKAQHYVSLRSVPRSASSVQTARRDRLAGRDPPYHQGNAGLYNAQDMYYITDITVGNKTVPVTIDTGSSDTWFVQSPFTCMDYYGRHVEASIAPRNQANSTGLTIERNQNVASAPAT